MAERFSQRLWDRIADLYAAILRHPFVQGLVDGSLDRDVFRFYVIQDALYLTDYARALARCGARAPDAPAVRLFCEHAAEAIAVERRLHESYFADFGITEQQVAATEPAPTNLAYTSFLLAATAGSFAEALGAVLPCYWIYREVGRHLSEAGSPDPMYGRWIETYGGDDYGAVVEAVLRVTDSVGPGLGRNELGRLESNLRITARYEWMFWDMAYRLESWPV